MKILYFSQFYAPESIAPAFRAADNARIWASEGNKVTVFTGYPNYPKGEIFKGYEAKLLDEEQIDGVRVIRSKLVAVPNTSFLKRIENSVSFFFFGLVNILFSNRKRIGKDYDVVLGTSGVIFTALLAWIFAAMHKLPFVFEIRDITYIQLQATGKAKNSLMVKGVRLLELFLCKRASKVVVVTNGFKKVLVKDGISEEKIEIITNGVDVTDPPPAMDHGKLILSYFGTLGLSQNIVNTFEYAKIISESCSDFEYLIIGEGAQKEQIKMEAESGKYSFVKMLPGMSAEELEPYYGFTRWSIITLRKSESFKYTLPSKLFQIMGRGVAVLFIGPEGEAAEIIREYDAGLVLTGTVDSDFESLRQFVSSSDWHKKLLEMGQNGRKAVQSDYSRKKLASNYLMVLEAAKEVYRCQN